MKTEEINRRYVKSTIIEGENASRFSISIRLLIMEATNAGRWQASNGLIDDKRVKLCWQRQNRPLIMFVHALAGQAPADKNYSPVCYRRYNKRSIYNIRNVNMLSK